MLEYLSGALAEVTPTYAVVDCGGVGYFVNISLPTYDRLNGQQRAKLLVHEIIREDTHDLYGFVDERERSLFRALIGVSGVGANTARMILSSVPAPELEGVIASGDYSRLKSVKGIGVKTAQRIIVDLKDKIKPTDDTFITQTTATSDSYDEALAALVMLGFPRPAAMKALKKLFDADPTLGVEAAIKRALTML